MIKGIRVWVAAVVLGAGLLVAGCETVDRVFHLSATNAPAVIPPIVEVGAKTAGGFFGPVGSGIAVAALAGLQLLLNQRQKKLLAKHEADFHADAPQPTGP